MTCRRCSGLVVRERDNTVHCLLCGWYEFPPYVQEPMRTSCYYSCGNPPAPGKVACETCAAKMKEYRSRRAALEKKELVAR